MSNVGMAFLLTVMAGFSTLLGALPIFVKVKQKNKMIAASLAFAAGVMLCVSITDLIPEAFLMLGKSYHGVVLISLTFFFLMIGIILSFMIDYIMPSVGDDGSLYKVGIISMVAIILHNLPEGIVTFISTTKDTSLGISLAIAIALHNIPEGISISVPIYYATKSKRKAILYTLISAISEPLGAVLTYLFLSPYISDVLLGFLYVLIAGIMIEISFLELLPTSIHYQTTRVTKVFFALGILFMLFKLFLG